MLSGLNQFWRGARPHGLHSVRVPRGPHVRRGATSPSPVRRYYSPQGVARRGPRELNGSDDRTAAEPPGDSVRRRAMPRCLERRDTVTSMRCQSCRVTTFIDGAFSLMPGGWLGGPPDPSGSGGGRPAGSGPVGRFATAELIPDLLRGHPAGGVAADVDESSPARTSPSGRRLGRCQGSGPRRRARPHRQSRADRMRCYVLGVSPFPIAATTGLRSSYLRGSLGGNVPWTSVHARGAYAPRGLNRGDGRGAHPC